MKLIARTSLRIALLLALTGFVSCESMLDDMGDSITSLQNQMTLILKGKPLPTITLLYETNLIPAGQLVDMGQWLVESPAPKTIQLTVTNTGPAPVSLEGITMNGKYAALFTIGSIKSQVGTELIIPATIPVDASFTFTISFELPAGETGYRAAILSINMGEDYSPFNVTVACEGTEEQKGLLVVGGMVGGLMTELDPSQPYDIGPPYNTPLRLWNRGTDDLLVNSIELFYGTDYYLSTITTPFTITPGSYRDIQAYFQPASYGVQLSDIITVDYDDSINSGLTFTLGLTGTMNEEQDAAIEVYKGSVSCPNNTTYTFHPQLTSSASYGVETFQIHNAGYGDLDLDIVVSGDEDYPNNNFTYSGPFRATVLPGEDTEFSVRYNPKDDANHSMTITIASNDPDAGDSPYVLTIHGTSLLPIIHVSEGATEITNGSILSAFGMWSADGDNRLTSPTKTITLTNNGSIPLDISSITTGGSDKGHFDINTGGTSMSIPANGGSTTFQVRFDPLAWDPADETKENAYITIASNDVDIQNYYINLNGIAKQALMDVTVTVDRTCDNECSDASPFDLELYWDFYIRMIGTSTWTLVSHQASYVTVDEWRCVNRNESGTLYNVPKADGPVIEFNMTMKEVDDWPNSDDTFCSGIRPQMVYDYATNQLLCLYSDGGGERTTDLQVDYAVQWVIPVNGLRKITFFRFYDAGAIASFEMYVMASDVLYQ